MTTVTIHVSPQDALLIYDKMEEQLMREEAWEPEQKRKEAEETIKECEEVEETIRRIEGILETIKPVRDEALRPRLPPSIGGHEPKTEIQLSIEDAELIRNEFIAAKERLENEVKHVEAILQTLSQTKK